MTRPRKPKPPAAAQPGQSANVPVSARISPELAKVLNDYIDSVKPRTTISAVLELALEQYFTSAGLWPPPAEQE